VDVERGLIQVRHGPGADVEVLPLTMVNLLQRVESADMVPESASVWRSSSTGDNSDQVIDQERTIASREDPAISSDSDTGTEDSEHGEVFAELVKQFESEDEFGEDELAKLIEVEGPSEILRLILQEQADDFMNEEITEGDDYADWIKWVAHAEQSMCDERTTKDTVIFASQQRCSMDTTLVPTPLQVIPTKNGESECAITAQLDSSVHEERDARWSEICQRIKVDRNLDEGRQQQLWAVLERYQDIFAWNKGELGCCTVGEHVIDTQGFPPCRAAPGRLSYWEEPK
jgi:tellurite resistance protein